MIDWMKNNAINVLLIMLILAAIYSVFGAFQAKQDLDNSKSNRSTLKNISLYEIEYSFVPEFVENKKAFLQLYKISAEKINIPDKQRAWRIYQSELKSPVNDPEKQYQEALLLYGGMLQGNSLDSQTEQYLKSEYDYERVQLQDDWRNARSRLMLERDIVFVYGDEPSLLEKQTASPF